MQSESTRAGMSMTGAALLAACACGTSAGIGRLTGSFGAPSGTAQIHPLFVLAGGAFIVAGLWRLGTSIRALALLGTALLIASEVLTPPMSLHGSSNLSAVQIGGLVAALLAAAALVAAFFLAYRSRQPSASLMAMSGAAMASGCNCCLVPMGMTGSLHALLPAQSWVSQTLTIYVVAASLMAIGLFRLRGFVPATMAVAGQAFLYFWLELPYSALPSITMHGVSVNFVVKYPMMFAGALMVMSAFAYAYQTQESEALTSDRAQTPAFGD